MTTAPCNHYIGGTGHENLPCLNCGVLFAEHAPAEVRHTTGEWYIIEGINPEPWESPTAMVGRRAGGTFARLISSDKQRAFQEAVKETFPEQNPNAEKSSIDLDVTFYFWRQIPIYETTGRKTQKGGQVADATNLQKALEDALQGLLYVNDRQVKKVTSQIVEQDERTDPLILIHVAPALPADFWLMELAEEMRLELHENDPVAEPGEDRDGLDIF